MRACRRIAYGSEIFYVLNMDICNSILSHLDLSADTDTISLTYDERFIRRKKLISDNGYEFLVDLEEMKSVFNDQAFKLRLSLIHI